MNDELIAACREAADRFGSALADVSESQLDALTEPGVDGVWSVRAHVHHAADVSLMAALRLRLMLAGAVLEYWDYEQAAFQRGNRYERGVESSLSLIAAVTESSCSILEQLTGGQWSAPFLLPDGRRVTFADWARNAAGHLNDHVRVITSALER